MSEHAQVIDGQVSGVVDLDPAIRSAWLAASNPKAVMYLPVYEMEMPNHDAAREVPVETWTVTPGIEAIRSWTIRSKTDAEMRQVWTTLDFLSRFHTSEMAQIETAREHDQIVQSFYRAALAAQEIVSDDPRTVAGVNYLSAIGILTLARVDEVLGR